MISNENDYYLLDSEDTNPGRLKKEREKAQKLRKSQWWLDQVNRGICHYCQNRFSASQLTMDHVVPLARGGVTAKGNVVPSCKDCNRDKKLHTPVDQILKEIQKT